MDRSDLPIPDFDHLPEGSLAHRIRSLGERELGMLLDYERQHADRLPVTKLIEQRMAALRSGAATPSEGDPGGRQPEHAPPADAGSPASGAGTPDTNQPLRHGDAAQTPNRQIRAR
jgi:hypothetical protein